MQAHETREQRGLRTSLPTQCLQFRRFASGSQELSTFAAQMPLRGIFDCHLMLIMGTQTEAMQPADLAWAAGRLGRARWEATPLLGFRDVACSSSRNTSRVESFHTSPSVYLFWSINQAEATRLAGLAWAAGLLGRARREVLAHTPLLLPPLLAALSAHSPIVANEAVRVLVRHSCCFCFATS